MEILSTVGSVLAIIAMGGIPFVIMNRRSHNKNLRSLNNLKALANESGAEIVSHNIWNDNSIGLDPQAKKLFFINKIQLIDMNTVIDLRDVLKCTLLTTSRNEKTNEGSQRVIDKVDINISFRNKKKPDTFMTCYNSSIDGMILNGELQLAEKWVKIINVELANIN